MTESSTSIDRDFYIERAGLRVLVKDATNLADALYRIQHEVRTFPDWQFSGTRQEMAEWYASCHEFSLDG